MFNKKNLKRILFTTLTLIMVIGTVAFATETRGYRNPSNYRRGRFHHNRRHIENRIDGRRFLQRNRRRNCVPRRNNRQYLRNNCGLNPNCRLYTN